MIIQKKIGGRLKHYTNTAIIFHECVFKSKKTRMTIQSIQTAVATRPLIEGKFTEQQLLTIAETSVTKKNNDCSLFSTKAEKAVPRFEFNGKTYHHFCNICKSLNVH
jgi:hypothetical protein